MQQSDLVARTDKSFTTMNVWYRASTKKMNTFAVKLPKMVTIFSRYSWALEFLCDSTVCKL